MLIDLIDGSNQFSNHYGNSKSEGLMEQFNVIAWLENEVLIPEGGESALKPCQIENVLYFSLVWNEFESVLVNAKENAREGINTPPLNIEKINTSVKLLKESGLLELDDFLKSLELLKCRYIRNGKPNEKFEFRFRRGEWEERAKQNLAEVLLGERTDDVDVVFALLSIAWRLRNNLFHGIKHLSDLKEQNENFGVINQVLANFAKTWKSSGIHLT